MSTVRWEGLTTFAEALRQLPEELRGEAEEIVDDYAERAAQIIRQRYPIDEGAKHPGDLRGGLTVESPSSGQFGATRRVVNRSKIAQIWEHGTAIRHTAKGAFRGQMQPPGNVFIPTVIQQRRLMVQALKALVARAGFEVRGDA